MSVSDTRGGPSAVGRADRNGSIGSNGSNGRGFAAPATPSTRLRKPRWRDARLVLGIVIVAVCALVGYKIVAASDSTVAVWAATRAIPAGSTIRAGDLTTERVRFSGSLPQHYLPGSSHVAGSVAVRAIGAGELIPRQGIRSSGEVRFEFPLAVPTGNLPAGLAVGDHVDVWIADGSAGSAGSSGSAGSAAGGKASLVWQDVVLLSVDGAKDSAGAGNDRQVVVALSQAQETALGSSLTTVASGDPYLVRRSGG